MNEFLARDAANVKWLEDSLAAGKDQQGSGSGHSGRHVRIRLNAFGDETWLRHSGFTNFGPKLIELSAAYGKPVLLVYGDSHMYRQSRPFPNKAPNLLALEVPGEKLMHAVEVTVDTTTSGVFSTTLVQNPAVLAN